jgi:hypothetical protein
MPGGLHHPGCDVQRCPVCLGQLHFCDCWFDELGADPEEDEEDERIVLESYLDSNGVPTERVLLNGQEMIIHYEDVPESDLTTVNGIPCTTALRTLIDIAPDMERADLELAARDALQRELFTLDEAKARFAEDDMKERPGALLLREVLFG